MKNIYPIFKYLGLVITILIFLPNDVYSQKVTSVKGVVIDSKTKQPLPFVDVGFLGTSIGTNTDLDGKFELETRFPSDTVFASFLGYDMQYILITKEHKNKLVFELKDQTLQLKTVEIVAKKEKYSKKNNPALDLAQLVIANRNANRLKGKDFYSYDQYEKIRLDINNITTKVKESPLVKKLDFVWKYVDTSNVNGKTFLPIFMRETSSSIYYKKSGNILREHRHGSKISQIEGGLDPQTINNLMDALYQDIDVYEPKIHLLGKAFVSPFAKAGYNFYRYYILDTTAVNGVEAINLAFIPAVKGNFGFTGNIFVTNDGKFSVLKVDMTIVKGINLNFVNDIQITQEFSHIGDAFVKTKDQLVVDYGITSNSVGVYGTRTVTMKDFDFSEPDAKYFEGTEQIVYDENSEHQSESFWNENRFEQLDQSDENLYQMIDTLDNNRYFKRYKYAMKLFSSGFLALGGLNVGPLNSFFTFNDAEGLNMRFGGQTNLDFHKKLKLSGYVAYAKKTKKWKYSAGVLYSFNDNFEKNPRHYIRATAMRESEYPGRELEFFDPDNLFFSFQRGDASKMLYSNTYELNYTHETAGLSYYITARKRIRQPYGSLKFITNTPNDILVDDITTSEFSVGIRYAKNEKFLQGKKKRKQLLTEFPIMRLDFTKGIKGILGGNYNYSKLKFKLIKRHDWVVWGSTRFVLDAGKTWGNIPYLLQLIPRGNQSYAYSLESFNMMNYLEFTSDQFVSLKLEHFFNGLVMNRIPLIKKLKWREVISVKSIYGSLSNKHNPNLHTDQIQFPVDKAGQPTTFLFGEKPYVEASFGLTNVFKIFRVDLVKRMNYLNHPNVPSLFKVKGLGMRVRFHLEF